MGISMGGFGALLLAEKRPDLVAAAADAVTHAAADPGAGPRRGRPRRPVLPGIQALARALPKGAVVDLTGGCRGGSFFTAQRVEQATGTPP